MSTIELAEPREALEALGRLLPGRVVLPGDPAWPTVRLPWTVNVDQHPAAVVTVRDADDVATVVRHAASCGLTVSAQPLGHGASPALSGTVLLRTGALDELRVDPASSIARVGAGTRWGALQSAAAAYDLTGLVGSSHDPTVVGLALGGGMSWFGRPYGFTANTVRAVELVDPAGERVRVDADSDPDLFWALRGGGGEFGLVTAMELELQPLPGLHGGRLLWPIEQASAVWRAYLELAESAPAPVTVWSTLLQLPPLPTIPEPLRGGRFATIELACVGGPELLAAALRPLRGLPAPLIDQTGPVPLTVLDQVLAEPVDPMPSLHHAELVDHLDASLVDDLLDAVGPDSGSRLLMVHLRRLGGALAREAVGGGAVGSLSEDYLVMGLGVPFDPASGAALGQDLGRLREAVAPAATGRVPYNFFTPGEDRTRVHAPDTLARLRALKDARDPERVIRSNLPL